MNTGPIPGDAVSVEILGRTYQIRSQDDREHVARTAKLVNEKMLEIERATRTVDTIRVAVLTALNLADELLKQKQNYETRLKALESEHMRALERVEQVLEER